MYLWQRLAPPEWWAANEVHFGENSGIDVAVIERPDRKQLTIEVCCRSRTRATWLQRRFGGRVRKLGRNWRKQFTRPERYKPLHIGKRLIITNVGGTLASQLQRTSAQSPGQGPARIVYAKRCGRGRFHIVIPAGAAFGTGQHATTAMSLRLLEELTRRWKPGWSMADLGTGSGIFALAAKRLGARHVIGVDTDPIAISTAKANARLNRIRGVDFQVGDVRRWRLPVDVNVGTANLFSELLIEVLPKLRPVPWLILSGVMRHQERDVCRALKRNAFAVLTVRRRGKWVALLAHG